MPTITTRDGTKRVAGAVPIDGDTGNIGEGSFLPRG
jgi:hypothetical protein